MSDAFFVKPNWTRLFDSPGKEAARVRDAEDAVIAGIPADLMATITIAQAKHEANGGCPGCGSMILAIHRWPCSEISGDLY